MKAGRLPCSTPDVQCHVLCMACFCWLRLVVGSRDWAQAKFVYQQMGLKSHVS